MSRLMSYEHYETDEADESQFVNCKIATDTVGPDQADTNVRNAKLYSEKSLL